MLIEKSAIEIAKEIKERKLSALEVCETFYNHCKEENQKTNALIRLDERALEKAKLIDEGKVTSGELLGVPIVVKDNFCIKGRETSACSKILEGFVSPYTAHCIERLEKQGAIVIAQSNMDEFAMGSSNETSAYGPCKNPIDLTRVPGGSSGGSAAAVAQKMAPISVGSDTGGSIRQPASFCGVTGIKPTYGAVSRYGMIAFASSLDQAGPLARNVNDAALALKIMIGKDVRDSTNIDFDFKSHKETKNKKYKVGIIKEFFESDLQPEIKNGLDNMLKMFKDKGWEVVEVEIPHTRFAIPVYYLIAASEASSNLSRYDGIRYGLRDINIDDGRSVNELKEFYKLTRSRGLGNEVKRRILLGTFALSAGYYDEFYIKACRVRRLIFDDFQKAFQKCDHIVGPVTTHTAFKINEKNDDPIKMYNNDILTVPASLSGLPCMSLPMGKDDLGLPFGAQIISPQFEDSKMIEFASQVEQLFVEGGQI